MGCYRGFIASSEMQIWKEPDTPVVCILIAQIKSAEMNDHSHQLWSWSYNINTANNPVVMHWKRKSGRSI